MHKTNKAIVVLDTPFKANHISIDDKIAIVMPVENPIKTNGKNFNILLNIGLQIMNAKIKKINKKNPWLQRQDKDPFVKMAKEMGYKSRAAFKLLEIDKKYKLLKNASIVCDIGAAPGGWSQVISQTFQKSQPKTNKSLKIIAIDLLDMETIPFVQFIKGDFTHKETLDMINDIQFDLIVSDMAPNTSGHQETDHLKSMTLSYSVLEFVKQKLNPNCNFAIKIFLGSKEKQFVDEVKKIFQKVEYFKPESSRSESKEIYIIGLNKK